MTSEPADVRTLTLRLSGRLFQWRTDGWWRALNSQQQRAESAESFIPGDDDWNLWSGHPQRMGKAGAWSEQSRWHLVYSELSPGTTPHILLDDATEPPIHRIGGLWISEWVSIPQRAPVTVGTQRWVTPFHRRPDYLRRDIDGVGPEE